VAKNKSRPLDLARADTTTEVKSQYRIGNGQGVESLYIYAIAIPDSDIASVIAYRGWQGAKALMLAMSDL